MLRVPLIAGVAVGGMASVMLAAPESSFAQSRYEWQIYYEDRSTPRTPLEVWLSGEGWDEDYRSSHVCINGYRWMTRSVEPTDASAADDSVPVRC